MADGGWAEANTESSSDSETEVYPVVNSSDSSDEEVDSYDQNVSASTIYKKQSGNTGEWIQCPSMGKPRKTRS